MVRGIDADELDPEAPERVQRYVERKKARRSGLESALDHVHEQRGSEQVPEELVQKRRVIGRLVDERKRTVDRVDLEAPREIGRLAVQLLIPPVSDPPDGLRHEQPRREAVGEQPHVCAGALRDDAADETAGSDATPDTEAPLPDRERTPPLIGHFVPARGEVVEAGTDDARADTPHRTPEDQVPVAAAIDETRAGDPDRDGDCGEERQPVHVDRERPEVERAGARRGDRKQKTHAETFSPRRKKPLRHNE